MRIGIISDIHANDVALETVLQAMGPVDRLWCLGDVVGYGPNPNETVARLLQQPSLEICLTGNHDWAALGKIDLGDFNPEARQAALWTRGAAVQREQAVPAGSARAGGARRRVYAGPRQPAPAGLGVHHEHGRGARELRPLHHPRLHGRPHPRAGHLFHGQPGHRALPDAPEDAPLNLRDGSRFIINPGSVGQPRDNDPRAAYALLDSDSGMLTFHRVAYDIALTQQRMFEVGLPARLILRLNYGW